MLGEGVDQVGIVDVFIGIQVSVTTISASSSTAVTPFGATPKVAITMRCGAGHGIPQGDLPLEASRHAAMQVLAEQEGVVRQVLDDELLARAGRRDVLGLAVTIHHRGQSGKVRIRYKALDQLDELCRRLRG